MKSPFLVNFLVFILLSIGCVLPGGADESLSQQTIFNDKLLMDGYAEKFHAESLDTILAMIKDDTLDDVKMAAAVRVFRKKYSAEVVSRQKNIIVKTLIRGLNRTDSAFVEVEIMHTLCTMDRYQYFAAMIPAIILKLDHYDTTVNELAYEAIDDIIKTGNNRTLEARIIFNTLRKILFLSRRRIASAKEPDVRLTQKIKLLRWSMKVLGRQEIRRLPKEVIPLL